MGLLIGALVAAGLFWFTAIGLKWSLLAGLAVGILVHFKVGVGNATTPSGGGGGFFNGVGTFFRGLFRSVWGLIFGSVIFLGLVMALSRFLNIAPAKVTESMESQGLNPLHWVQADGPVVLFILCLILLLFACYQAATGNTRMAKWMVFLSIAFGILYLYLPLFTAKVLPSENGKPTWNAADQALVKAVDNADENGIVPALTTAVTKIGGGKVDPDEGVWPSWKKRFHKWWLGKQKPPTETRHRSSRRQTDDTTERPAESTITVVKVGCVSRLLEFRNGQAETTITNYKFRIYPKGGCVTAFPPDGETYTDCPGVDDHTSHGPGPWSWKSADDSDATGVEVCE